MRERLTDDEWDTLLFAPILANNLFWRAAEDAGQSGVGPAVIHAFGETLKQAHLHVTDPLAREVVLDLVFNGATIMQRATAASATLSPGDAMIQAVGIADRVSAPEEATGYRQFLIDMCEASARAIECQPGSEVDQMRSGLLQAVRDAIGAQA
jgi:hypothetical protein